MYGRKVEGKRNKKQDIEETACKLRAIKQRQGQWMRERDEAKASLSSSRSLDNMQRRRTSSTNSHSDINSSPDFRGGSSKGPFSNPRRKPLYTPPKKDQSNIITWSGHDKLGRPPSAQRRKQSKDKLSNNSSGGSQSSKEKIYRPSNYSSTNHLKSLDNTQSLSGYSEILKTEHYVDEKNNIGDSIESNNRQESFLSRDLDPDMINTLADSVAKKLSTKVTTEKIIDKNQNIQEEIEEMSTHMCPLCHTLMTGTRHTPMASIPCGHTLCNECLQGCYKCPCCQSRISSSAENTVLKQIITDFLSLKEKKRLEKLEQETRKYVDEYQSLSVRSNALAEEADIILNGMEELTEDLFQEKKVFKRLELDNDELTKKIHDLQKQLDKNKLKLTESKEKTEIIESKYEEEKQRLSLVEDTIRTITQSKERVKMMVHNFAPSFNLEQFE